MKKPLEILQSFNLHDELLFGRNEEEISLSILISEVQKECKKDNEAKANKLLSALKQIANAPQPLNNFENEVFVSVATDIARKALSFYNAT